MNCKPGDLAVVVSLIVGTGPHGGHVEVDVRGRVVSCVTLASTHDECVGWQVTEPLVTWYVEVYPNGIWWEEITIDVIGDEYLRPIRDPGVDAVDEMVRLLGKPETAPDAGVMSQAPAQQP
jgi:hypothetical protein